MSLACVTVPPLSRFAKFSSGSLDFVRDAMSKAYCEHRIVARDRVPSLTARHHQAELQTTSINYLTYGANITVTTPQLPDFYLIDFPLAGSASYRVGNRDVICSPGHGCIISPGSGLRTEWSADCELLTLKFARKTLERYLADILDGGVTEQLRFEPELDFSTGSGASLRSMVDFLAFELDHSDSLRRVPRWCTQMERTIAIGLLSTQRHNYSDRLRERGRSICPGYVRRAEAFIRANLCNDIDIEKIAAAAGVPARTLFAAYRRSTGQSPIAHLRELRLQAVHAELQRAGRGDNVASIACRWGFYHLGHFSRDYRARFGERPSETLKANR
jgi:AraC-like DNA-binding protein